MLVTISPDLAWILVSIEQFHTRRKNETPTGNTIIKCYVNPSKIRSTLLTDSDCYYFRFKQLKTGNKYFNISGLNSVAYRLKEIKIKPTHVHIFVDQIKKEVCMALKMCLNITFSN